MSEYATKINALLAKAASTEHDAERDTFTEAAERLMVKWGIDDVMLSRAEQQARESAKVPIEQRAYRVEGANGKLLAELVAATVAMGIGPVRALIDRSSNRWWCVGYTDDLARVELYVPQLVEQARDAWSRYLARTSFWNGTDRERAKRTFLATFGATVAARLEAMFREAATTGLELALTRRTEHVQTELARLNPRLGRARRRTYHGPDVAAAGRAAGQQASITAGALG